MRSKFFEGFTKAGLVPVVAIGGLLLVYLNRSDSLKAFHTVLWAMTLTMVYVVPFLIAAAHRREQDRTLDKIRAAFVSGLAALDADRRQHAERLLLRIRRLERHWRIGASTPLQASLVAAMFTTGAFFLMSHLIINLLLDDYARREFHLVSIVDAINHVGSRPWSIGVLGILAALAGLGSIEQNRDVKARPWAEFYGDKLAAAIKAGRGIATAPQHDGPAINFATASPREIFGLEQHFTKAELRRAWIRLAGELHPDRWASAGAGVQQLKEAALKRVNAARDELEGLAA